MVNPGISLNIPNWVMSSNFELVQQIASTTNGTLEKIKGDVDSYKIIIDKILIHIMDAGSGQRSIPYDRISFGSIGSLDVNGKPSSERGITHIDIIDPNQAYEQIMNILQ